MKKITAVLIGAGQRGRDCYAPYALKYPNEIEFVAVAEADPGRREAFCKEHDIDQVNAYESYEGLYEQGKIADAVLICTQDRMHFEPAMKAMELGYHILLEKPMSTDIKETFLLSEAAKSYKKSFLICHVLRYTPFFMELKRLLDDNVIGQVVAIQHNENVGFWHQAHSYVRGNWRDTKVSSPMILAKSSHDMDILYWLLDRPCIELHSYGSLKYFNEQNAPEGAPNYCMDGCPVEDDCPYSAKKIYISNNQAPQFKVLRSVVSDDGTNEGLIKALTDGPYGRCVFRCDNNAVDHQTVNLLFEDDITVAFTMAAFTNECSRTIKIMGTHGEIRGHMEDSVIEILDFNSSHKTEISVSASGEGHGGGDEGLMRDFVKYVSSGIQSNRLSFAVDSYQSHLMSMTAEASRLSGKAINLKTFEKGMIKG